jgi:hypothetical protein
VVQASPAIREGHTAGVKEIGQGGRSLPGIAAGGGEGNDQVAKCVVGAASRLEGLFHANQLLLFACHVRVPEAHWGGAVPCVSC